LGAIGLLERAHRVLRVLDLTENPARVMAELLAGFGERELTRDPLEETQADRLLQLVDLHRHGRLRQMQFFGGSRKTRIAARHDEDLQLTQRERADEVHGRASATGSRAARSSA
jgi:hypothetical protein